MSHPAFFRQAQSSPSSSQPFALAPSRIKPIRFTDGRIYDLLEPRAFDIWDLVVRWKVEIDVQVRGSNEIYLFKTLVHWSAVRRDALHSYHSERGEALFLIGRERIVDYLRHHPEPHRCCSPFVPILLEFC